MKNWEAGFLGHITATRSRSAGRSVGRSVNAARSRRTAVASCSLRAACFFGPEKCSLNSLSLGTEMGVAEKGRIRIRRRRRRREDGAIFGLRGRL